MSETKSLNVFCGTPLACHVASQALHEIGAIAARYEVGSLGLGEAVAQIDERVRVIREMRRDTPTARALAIADTRLTSAVLESFQASPAPNSNSYSKENARAEDEVPKTESNSYTKEQPACQDTEAAVNSPSISPFGPVPSGSLSPFETLRTPSLS